MPTLQYPNNPNTDTAFVVQDDGTKNRALMTAPQDTSTLELPSNPNSTKGYVTIDGKKQRVVLTADITGGGSGGDQHNLGWYATESALTTAHPTAEAGDWAIVGATDTVWVWDTDTTAWKDTGAAGIELPDQTGNAGKFLITDGTSASWGNTIGNIKITKLNDQNKYVSWFCDTDYLAGSAVCMLPYSSDGQRFQLGKSNYYFSNIFTQKIQNPVGGAITVPSVAGELAVKQVNTTITLTSAGWSSNTQTVNVTGITTTGIVFVSPDPTDQADYTDAGIICSAQAANSLTFTCDTTPTSDIDVVVVQL
jgi:hypothetical protein